MKGSRCCKRRGLFAEDFDTSENGADYDVVPSGEYFLMLGQRWAQRTLVFIVDGIPKDAAGDRVLR